MADIEITHTRAEGTILTGSRKGDGIFEIVRPHGFWFSRQVRGLFIKRSRDQEADMWRINAAVAALREAGHEVTVDINEEVRRSFAEIEADREERAEERAERYSDRADRASTSADARRATADQISRRFEFGQPILVGHHSEGRARRDAARIDTNMRASFEERDRARYWTNRSQSAESHAEYRNDPHRTLRRLEKLRAGLRFHERQHEEAVEKGYDSVGREARRIQDLIDEIAYWEKLVERAEADGVKVWGPDDFAPGDFVRYRGVWHQVSRVNPKTLSIAWNMRLYPKQVMTLEDATETGYRVGLYPVDYTKFAGRCPEEAMLAFLADGKVPGTVSAGEASEAAPAAAVREAQAAAKKSAPKKKSDPKIPKGVRIDCRWNATKATMTWLNGRRQPHRDRSAVTIEAPEGVEYTEAVWSKPLLAQVTELLAEEGFVTQKGGWSGGVGRGLVCTIVPAEVVESPDPEEQPAPGPTEAGTPPVEEAAIEEQPPAAEPDPAKAWGRADFKKGDYVQALGQWHLVTRSNPRSVSIPDQPWLIQWDMVTGRRSAAEMAEAEGLAAEENEDQAPVDVPPAEPAEEESAATAKEIQNGEQTALTCDFPESTRNPNDRSGVSHSVHPLHPTPEEPAMSGSQRPPTQRERKQAQMADMVAREAYRPVVERTERLDALYRRYVDDGIASTDAYYCPIDFEDWAHTLGAWDVAAEAAEKAEAATPAPTEPEPTEPAPAEPEPAEAEKGTPAKRAPRAKKAADAPAEKKTPAKPAPRAKKAAETPAEPKAPAKRTPRKKPGAPAPAAPVAPEAEPATAAPAVPEVEPAPEQKVVQKSIPTDKIDRDPTQPREIFDQDELDKLAKSMARLGQLQPVTVRYVPATKRYTLVMGERRWRSAKAIGLAKMTALVLHGVPDGARETLAKSTAENVGRADMTPIEEAKAFKRLVDAEYTIDEIAEMCGKSAAYVGWRIDLLRLCDSVREALAKGILTVGLAWYVSLLNTNNQMRFLVRHARGEFKSTREAEAFAQAARTEEKRQEDQGSFFVLAEEAPVSAKDSQESLPRSLDIPEEERERITSDRAKLVKKIDKLGDLGATLAELATADPEDLALLLAGTPGGVPGHMLRIEHLREVALRATKTLRQAQAIAAVRAGSIQLNPEAVAPAATVSAGAA